MLVGILEGAIPPPHCTESLLVFRLLYIILDGQYLMFVSSMNNDHTRILQSKIIKIEILPPEFVFWSAKCHVWQAFTKYPNVVYLNKLLRNSKNFFFIQDDMMRFLFARTLMIINNSITMGRQIMSQSQVHGLFTPTTRGPIFSYDCPIPLDDCFSLFIQKTLKYNKMLQSKGS